MQIGSLQRYCAFSVFLATIFCMSPSFAADEASSLSADQRFERLENRLVALERKALGKGQASNSTLMADHEARLQAIESESSKIYGTAEEVAHAVEQLAEKIDLIVKDLEVRLQDIENAISSGVVAEKKTPITTAEPSAQANGEKPQPVPDGIAADALYNEAYGFMKKAAFASAEHWFEVFTERYPGHGKTENAYYWLGEVRLVRKEPQKALVAFGESIKKFPEGRRAPDSLLKMGVAFREIGKVELAKTTWQKLVKDFPEAPAAESAKKYLAQL